MSAHVSEVIIALGCSVALPVGVVSLIVRERMHKVSKRAEVIMAAIERNPETDIRAFVGKLSQRSKGIKEQLLNRLTLGLACLAIGLGLLATCLYSGLTHSWKAVGGGLVMSCGISIMLGLALIAAFAIGQHMFRKEMERDTEDAQAEA